MNMVLLIVGIGLMTIGLVILALTWRLRATWARAAARSTKSAATEISQAPEPQAPASLPQMSIERAHVTQNDLQSTIYDMAQGLVIKADELASAAVGAAEEEGRVIESDARARSEEIAAKAENDAQQIRHDATQDAKSTIRGAMHAASHLQAETRALTDSAVAEIGSSVTALNELLATLSSFSGVDATKSLPSAPEADPLESEPATRNVKDDVMAILANFNYLRRSPEAPEDAHDESAIVRNGTSR